MENRIIQINDCISNIKSFHKICHTSILKNKWEGLGFFRVEEEGKDGGWGGKLMI
jgi:hypothetical protein